VLSEDAQTIRRACQRLNEVFRERFRGEHPQAGSISKLRSMAGTECVSAPMDT
jgi:hypothetical protein